MTMLCVILHMVAVITNPIILKKIKYIKQVKLTEHLQYIRQSIN